MSSQILKIILITLCPVLVHAKTVSVLHWWTEPGEVEALGAIKVQVASQGLQWQDVAIEGGAGVGAVKVLKSLILSNQIPDAAQIIGPSLQDWSNLGFLLDLSDIAKQDQWHTKLPTTVNELIEHKGQTIAVPLGIHRINNLFFSQPLFDRHQLTPPENWSQFHQVASQLKEKGVMPLALSSQPWQVATLFETVLLSYLTAEQYRNLLVEQDTRVIDSQEFLAALNQFKSLKGYADDQFFNRDWLATTSLVSDQKAGMLIMGDWARGAMRAKGLDDTLGCALVPGTKGKHLYSIDTLAFFDKQLGNPKQKLAAQILMSSSAQVNFSQHKGTFPSLVDVPVDKLDACAQVSREDFYQAMSQGNLAPSLVHRMANSDRLKDKIMELVHRFFMSPSMPAEQLQAQLHAALNQDF